MDPQTRVVVAKWAFVIIIVPVLVRLWHRIPRNYTKAVDARHRELLAKGVDPARARVLAEQEMAERY